MPFLLPAIMSPSPIFADEQSDEATWWSNVGMQAWILEANNNANTLTLEILSIKAFPMLDNWHTIAQDKSHQSTSHSICFDQPPNNDVIKYELKSKQTLQINNPFMFGVYQVVIMFNRNFKNWNPMLIQFWSSSTKTGSKLDSSFDPVLIQFWTSFIPVCHWCVGKW